MAAVGKTQAPPGNHGPEMADASSARAEQKENVEPETFDVDAAVGRLSPRVRNLVSPAHMVIEIRDYNLHAKHGWAPCQV